METRSKSTKNQMSANETRGEPPRTPTKRKFKGGNNVLSEDEVDGPTGEGGNGYGSDDGVPPSCWQPVKKIYKRLSTSGSREKDHKDETPSSNKHDKKKNFNRNKSSGQNVIASYKTEKTKKDGKFTREFQLSLKATDNDHHITERKKGVAPSTPIHYSIQESGALYSDSSHREQILKFLCSTYQQHSREGIEIAMTSICESSVGPAMREMKVKDIILKVSEVILKTDLRKLSSANETYQSTSDLAGTSQVPDDRPSPQLSQPVNYESSVVDIHSTPSTSKGKQPPRFYLGQTVAGEADRDRNDQVEGRIHTLV